MRDVTKPDAHLPSVATVCRSEIRVTIRSAGDGYDQDPPRTDERLRISRTLHSLKIWSSMSDGRSINGFGFRPIEPEPRSVVIVIS